VVDRLLSLDARRRSAIAAADKLRNEQKTLGKQIPKAPPEEKQQLLATAKELAAQVKAAEAEQNEASEEFDQVFRAVPNLVHPDAPIGGEPADDMRTVPFDYLSRLGVASELPLWRELARADGESPGRAP